VECDGATYHSARSARDRDRLRQEVLEGLGWRLHRIWSTDWFRNPKRETDKLLAAICEAAENQQASTVDVDSTVADVISTEPTDESLVVANDGGSEIIYRNSNVEDYKECGLSVPIRRALLDLSVSEVARLSQLVVEAEGPVHIEEVARRIREAFGLQKTGNRILTHVRNSLVFLSRNGVVAQDRDFWFVPGRAVNFIRSRRTAALPLRKAAMIAPAEYQLGISTAVEEAVAISREDLLFEVARLFGFDRTGPDLKQEIKQQVDVLVQNGLIIDDGGRLCAAGAGTSSTGRDQT
jgi:very-short-patch-repair endonuclease